MFTKQVGPRCFISSGEQNSTVKLQEFLANGKCIQLPLPFLCPALSKARSKYTFTAFSQKKETRSKRINITLSMTLTSKNLKGRISGEFLKDWVLFFNIFYFFSPSLLPQIQFYSFSSSFLTSENRHVSPKGTIKCVFLSKSKGYGEQAVCSAGYFNQWNPSSLPLLTKLQFTSVEKNF